MTKVTKGIFDRVFKSWRTSLLGLGFLFFGGALVWAEKASLAEFAAFITAAFVLFFVKETPKGES